MVQDPLTKRVELIQTTESGQYVFIKQDDMRRRTPLESTRWLPAKVKQLPYMDINWTPQIVNRRATKTSYGKDGLLPEKFSLPIFHENSYK